MIFKLLDLAMHVTKMPSINDWHLAKPSDSLGIEALHYTLGRYRHDEILIMLLLLQPVEGFNATNPFDLYYPDTMHQTELGDQVRLVDGNSVI